MVDWSREKFIKHFLIGENLSLVTCRQSTDEYYSTVQISKYMIDNRYHFSYKGTASQFPLYLYSETNGQLSTEETAACVPNLNPEIVNTIAKQLGLTFVAEKEPEGNVCIANNKEVRPEFRQIFAPIDILDYIYAVLHSPTYRSTYKEFLKIDFPKIPYQKTLKPSGNWSN
nr:type ISP restriction/modification enzyme [uncultured Flavobacterium sp.]